MHGVIRPGVQSELDRGSIDGSPYCFNPQAKQQALIFEVLRWPKLGVLKPQYRMMRYQPHSHRMGNKLWIQLAPPAELVEQGGREGVGMVCLAECEMRHIG